MGACITALDNMLKLSSTENALEVDFDINHEMKVMIGTHVKWVGDGTCSKGSRAIETMSEIADC